tara:strand:+ start:789 stop:1244 length:456 start_codon:yes stop_codon:yes gene_type:complete
MKLLIDTREQKPLKFKHRYISSCVSTALPYGDYACQFTDGHVPCFYFERKSINDLFGTLGKGYSRFKREIGRAQKDNVTLIIAIEGTLTDILKGCRYSKRDPNSLTKQLFTLMLRHWVPWVGFRNRTEMSKWITAFYLGVGREYTKNKKTK